MKERVGDEKLIVISVSCHQHLAAAAAADSVVAGLPVDAVALEFSFVICCCRSLIVIISNMLIQVWQTTVTMRYDTRCYFNVRSKADTSQLNLPHRTDN